MTTKILIAATALILSAGCCGQTTKKAAPETRTAVTHGNEIALQTPAKSGGASIDEALWARRSSREYSAEALSLEELSGVLWAAAGVNRPESGHLTAPSAMALYPIEVYAFFAEGVYKYDAKTSKLTRVLEGDRRKLAGMQDFVYTAPLNIVLIANTAAYEGRSIPAEQVRYLCGLDAAGYAENVHLYTAGHGLKSITRGMVPAAELLAALGLDAERYFCALAVTVGK